MAHLFSHQEEIKPGGPGIAREKKKSRPTWTSWETQNRTVSKKKGERERKRLGGGKKKKQGTLPTYFARGRLAF